MINCILAIQMIYDAELKNIAKESQRQQIQGNHLSWFITRPTSPEAMLNIGKVN